MGKDKEWPVSAMTKQEREEMLSLQEQGEVPDIIDRSTGLYFRFLLGTPARNTHLTGGGCSAKTCPHHIASIARQLCRVST